MSGDRAASEVAAPEVAVPEAGAAAGTQAAPRKPKDKRQAILDAALSLFVERGFYGTAVPLVSKRAGVSTGTIYNYFDSKESLVNALFRELKQGISAHVFTNFPGEAAPREQLHAIWTYMTEFALRQPDAFAFLELHHHASYLDDASRALEQQLRQFAATVLERGKAMGVIKPMPTELLMDFMFGAFVGTMRGHWEGRIVLGEAEIAQAEQACWDAIAVAQPRSDA